MKEMKLLKKILFEKWNSQKYIYIYKRYFSISNNFYNNPSFVIKKTSTSYAIGP